MRPLNQYSSESNSYPDLQGKKLNVAIVGSGLAGLSAAAYLLALKSPTVSVTLFEKSPEIGGRAGTAHKEGFSINQGPHALYRGGKAMAFLQSQAINITGGPPNTFDGTAVFGGEFFTLPLSPGDMIKTKLFGTGEKMELASFLMGLGKIDRESLRDVSAAEWLNKISKNDKVKQFLQALLRLCTYSNDPTRLSAAAAVNQLTVSQAGVLYVDGGWQTLVDGLHGRINALLAENSDGRQFILKTGTAVTGLQSGKMVTVESGSGKQDFDAVILAVPPEQIAKIAPNLLGDDLLANLNPGRVAALDVCLKRAPAEKNQYGLGIDQPLYYSMHSKAARLTPGGDAALIHLAYYLAPGEVGGQTQEKAMLDLLDRLQPGWREELIFSRYLPEMKASFGTPLPARYRAQETVESAMEGVFLAGDFIGRDLFLADAAVSSALEAAHQAAARFDPIGRQLEPSAAI